MEFADLSCLNIIIIVSEIYLSFVDFWLDFRHFFFQILVFGCN